MHGSAETRLYQLTDVVATEASDHDYFPHHALHPDRPSLFEGDARHHHMSALATARRDDAYMMPAPPLTSVVPWLESLLVTSFDPPRAQPDSPVTITLQASTPPSPSITLYFFIGFQGIYSPGILTETAHSGRHIDFMLSTHVPPLSHESSPGPIPVSMVVEDAAGNRLMDRRIGQLTYANIDHLRLQPSPYAAIGKRKASLDSQIYANISNKRSKWSNVYGYDMPYPFTDSIPSPPSSHGANIPSHHADEIQPSEALYPKAERTYLSPARIGQTMSRQATAHAMEEAQSIAMTRSLSAYEGRLPITPQYSSPMINFDTRAAYGRSAVSSSPVLGAVPCASSRMRLASPSRSGAAVFQGRQDSRGVLQSPKTILALQANLDTMLRDWTDAELDSKRRLVVFERRQTSNTISASFRAVSPEEHTPGSVCVSCIWWEGKNASYITSVDTISLAESLCGYKFNVPVKNRIRRNMEGYKPITIAKDKEDCEDFFKVIMSFTNPKPRNIEKHIKVFPWTCLEAALRKIVSKYGRSSSSTKPDGSSRSKQTTTSASSIPSAMGLSMPFDEELSEETFMQPLSPASGVSSYAVSNGEGLSRATASPAFPPSTLFPSVETGPVVYRPYAPRLDPTLAQLVPQAQQSDYYYWPQAQVAFPEEHLYRNDEAPAFGGWGMPTFFDPNLTATPTSLPFEPQDGGGGMAMGLGVSLPQLGLPLMQAQVQAQAQSQSQSQSQLQQYAEDQPIDGSSAGHSRADDCFRGVTHL